MSNPLFIDAAFNRQLLGKIQQRDEKFQKNCHKNKTIHLKCDWVAGKTRLGYETH